MALRSTRSQSHGLKASQPNHPPNQAVRLKLLKSQLNQKVISRSLHRQNPSLGYVFQTTHLYLSIHNYLSYTACLCLVSLIFDNGVLYLQPVISDSESEDEIPVVSYLRVFIILSFKFSLHNQLAAS